MRRITEQGYARYPFPANPDRKSVDRPKHRLDLAFGNEGCKLGSPSSKLLRETRQASICVAEIDRSNPVLRLIQGNVDMQASVGIAMREDSFAGCNCHERATADRIRAGFIARVPAGEERLDKTGASVGWL